MLARFLQQAPAAAGRGSVGGGYGTQRMAEPLLSGGLLAPSRGAEPAILRTR
jgi:hypothetical protein